MGWAAGFSAGTQMANSAVNAYRQSQDYQDKELRKKDMADIASAKESEAYTPEQAAELEAASKAVGPDGKPYYTVGNDASGKYTITPNFQNETGEVPTDYEPSTMAAKGVTFLGKNYDAPLTETQTTGARQQAMAGVMERGGDVEGAMRYRQQAQQGVLMDKQLQQADLQMAQSKRTGAREDKADAYEASRQEAFNGSVFGQQNAAYAKQFQGYIDAKGKYEAGIAAGESPQTLGPPPQQPARAAYSLADSLADQGALLANDAKHGKVDAKTFGAFSESMRKIEDEGYLKALNLAQGGGSLDDVAKAFNSGGQVKFDPKSVLSDKMVPGQGGVPERVISFKDEGGNTQTINVMAQLKSLGKANEALGQFYAGETNRRGNAGEVRADKSLSIQQAQLGISASTAAMSNKLHGAQLEDVLQKTADKKALAGLHEEFNAAVDSGDGKKEAAARKKMGVMARNPSNNLSAFERKAMAYMEANPGANYSQAIEFANTKAQSSPEDVYDAYAKPSGTMGMPSADKVTKALAGRAAYLASARGVSGKTSEAPGGAAAPVKGTEQVISTGANKGKTAVFDGKGWVLAGGGSSQAALPVAPSPAASGAAPAATPTAAAMAGTPPGRNFYGAEAINERMAAERKIDAIKAAQAKAETDKAAADWEKMRQWRLANNAGDTSGKTLLNTNIQ